MDLNNQIIIYQTEDGQTQVDVRLENETVWLTQAQRRSSGCSENPNNHSHGTIEGKIQSRDVAHYNLHMIIALGYRVHSIKC